MNTDVMEVCAKDVSSDERLLLIEGGQIAMSRQMVEVNRRLHNIEQMLLRLLDTLGRFTAFWMRAPKRTEPPAGPTSVN